MVQQEQPQDSNSNSTSKLDKLLLEALNTSQKFTAVVDIPEVQDTMNPADCDSIIDKYAYKNNSSREDAVIAITLLVQNGGTNQSKKTLNRTVNGKKYSLEDLRAVIKEVNKTGTVRKFAKGIRDIIAQIATVNKWSGPLKNNLKINNPNLEITEVMGYWCLEIHSDNPKCPQAIKEALIRREEQLKVAQSQAITQSKPRSKRGAKTGKRK
jgi:hypothetical protein